MMRKVSFKQYAGNLNLDSLYLYQNSIMSSKSKKPNKIKLIKRISREAFMGADVRSKAYKDASKYSRKHKHKKDWSEQK